MSQKMKVAILGATGSVGQRFVQLLADHPYFEVHELVASDRSAGKLYSDVCDWRVSADIPQTAAAITVKGLSDHIESSVVFASLPGGLAYEVENRLASEGKQVFSNARDNRMEADVPLIIPEVNPEHLGMIDQQRKNRGWDTGLIVTNPNCSTIHLVMALKPIADAFGIQSGFVTTLQAVSGGGYPGVSSMDMIDNVVPFIGGEEEKIETESRKILGQYAEGAFIDADITFSTQCTRVPVRDGHTEMVSLKLNREASPWEVTRVLTEFQGVPQILNLPSAPKHPTIVRTEDDRPQPALDRNLENGMASIVGRIRPCAVLDVKFVVLGHNTIRGAAGASILNAELLYHKGYLDNKKSSVHESAEVS